MDLITTTKELSEVCERMTRHPFVTVDTEFLRESTYYPQLCVAQIASSDEAVVVDALAPDIDLKPFFDLMGNEQVLKVFHAARQDIEIVWHRANLIPHPIFDTQIAAMVLGYGDSVSYDQLVQRITGDALDKSSRFTDWTRRPLSKAQVEYAISDVTHLRDVYRKLQGDLDKRGRTEWLSRGDGHPYLARHLPDGAGRCLAAAAHPRAQAEGTCGADGSRGLARARGEVARCAARARAEGRSGRRYRDPGADLDRAAVVAAFAAERLRTLGLGPGNPGSGQARARPRSEDAAGDRTRQDLAEFIGHRRASEGAASHDRGTPRGRRQGDRDRRRSRTHRLRRQCRCPGAERLAARPVRREGAGAEIRTGSRSPSRRAAYRRSSANTMSPDRPQIPVARRVPHSFTCHGVTIEDPYAWLRDPGYPQVTEARGARLSRCRECLFRKRDGAASRRWSTPSSPS